MKKSHDRFGIPEENFRAAERSAKKQKGYLLHVYVPTRKEVATLKIEKLSTMLVGWMCKSPTEIIPSRTQITEVRNILLNREDASELGSLITMCNYYIHND
ncbi:hypothetical protein AAKU64_004106 [Undibacterium sp. GrIS 1.8]|uniref:hypothetical protein n=1 Tax=Undibacterium sp. GrIS 1.8 TaxID=3143934 RepID=UPI0033989467